VRAIFFQRKSNLIVRSVPKHSRGFGNRVGGKLYHGRRVRLCDGVCDDPVYLFVPASQPVFALQGEQQAIASQCDLQVAEGEPISMDHIMSDYELFFDRLEHDQVTIQVNNLLVHTIPKSFPWTSPQAQAHALAILLLLPHIQEVRLAK
jgi:hypothetical protein